MDYDRFKGDALYLEESLVRRAIFISLQFLQNEGYLLFITAHSSVVSRKIGEASIKLQPKKLPFV